VFAAQAVVDAQGPDRKVAPCRQNHLRDFFVDNSTVINYAFVR
jgi:hypothetical protein